VVSGVLAVLAFDGVDGESAAESPGRDAEHALERARERLLGFEAAVEREVDELEVGLAAEPTGAAHEPAAAHVGHDAAAHARGEQPREVERRIAGLRRYPLERQRLVELLLEPGDEVLERVGGAVHGRIIAGAAGGVLTVPAVATAGVDGVASRRGWILRLRAG